MVYYVTSGNVKMIRNILMDYTASSELSPYEYMKTYVEKCPETTEDAKISWIAETFLGIQKHEQFLREIAAGLSEELSQDDMDHMIIVFHAVTFQIEPKEMQNLYKCLFNISKPLLNTFTKFLSNNEVLTFISHVAQSYYDSVYISDKIIGPLFVWQPYISEMAHSYAEYIKKLESRKVKPPTVPVQPNVLNRKSKDRAPSLTQLPIPQTPPNSIRTKGKKMLTKKVIDEKLKLFHEKNQQKATDLLNSVRNKKKHYAQDKSDRYYKTINNIQDELENRHTMKTFVKLNYPVTIHSKNAALPVKETAATLKRLNKRVQLAEEEEVEWLQTLMTSCRNTAKIEEILEHDRQEKERERLHDIERKHLLGQISYEEAVIAKRKLHDENKRKYEEFVKEKEVWNDEIEKWRKYEKEKNRKQVEKLCMMELNLLHIKNNMMAKKKEAVDKIKKESEMILAKSMKEKQQELEYRINMIKEIKILALIAKKARVPKILDLTETSGIGSLCEMSMAELQERLSALKIGLNEELERKKKTIRNEKNDAKQSLEDAKKSIKNFMTDRANTRNRNKTLSNTNTDTSTSKEIDDLKKILVEKRQQRLNLDS